MYVRTSPRKRSVLEEAHIRAIRDALLRSGGNVRQVSFLLCIPYRTLSGRITRLGLRGELARIRREHDKRSAA